MTWDEVVAYAGLEYSKNMSITHETGDNEPSLRIRYYKKLLYFLYKRDGIEAMIEYTNLIDNNGIHFIRNVIRDSIINDENSPLSESDKVYYKVTDIRR